MSSTIDLPLLRRGRPYRSEDSYQIGDVRTGEPVARVSCATPGMLVRDLAETRRELPLDGITAAELAAVCRRAGTLFAEGDLPLGGDPHGTLESPLDYAQRLAASTGMPVAMVLANISKIRHVLENVDQIVAGLTRGLDPAALDSGWAVDPDGRLVSYRREATVLGAVLPNNSPGVHGLWIPALALKATLALKPGRREPWTPLRVASALLAAGCPPSALGVYPGSHDLAKEVLLRSDRSMLFGDGPTVAPWRKDPRVELHGPGWSKVWIGEDHIDEWPTFLDVLLRSVAANGGRSCLNASGIWVPRHGQAIAAALAERMATIPARGLDDPEAALAGFADRATAEAFDAWLESRLAEGGAEDVTARYRRGSRVVQVDGCWFLLPTLVWCERADHPLAQAELLFPFASVVEAPQSTIPEALGSTLVLTAITNDHELAARLLASPLVDRLNLGAIPTISISWDQPHEGNLFELLWRRRSLQGSAEVFAR